MSDFKLVQVEARHTHWPHWSLTILREDKRWHRFHSRTFHLPTCGKWTRSFRSPIKKRPGGISTISSLCLWKNAEKDWWKNPLPICECDSKPCPSAYVFLRVINLRHQLVELVGFWTLPLPHDGKRPRVPRMTFTNITSTAQGSTSTGLLRRKQRSWRWHWVNLQESSNHFQCILVWFSGKHGFK